MEVAQVVINIGVVRGNMGDFSGALKSWNKALAIYRKHGLEDEDDLVATLLSHQHLAVDLMKKRHKSSRRSRSTGKRESASISSKILRLPS